MPLRILPSSIAKVPSRVRWKLHRVLRGERLFGGNLRHARGIELRDITRACLLPARGGVAKHRDRHLRQRLLVPVADSARVEDAFHKMRRGENSRARESTLPGHLDHPRHTGGAVLRSERRRPIEVALHRGCAPEATAFSEISCELGMGNRPGSSCCIFANASADCTTRRRLSSSYLLVVARAVRPPNETRTEICWLCSSMFW